MKNTLYVVGGLAAFLVGMFVLQSIGMFNQNFFGKWREANRAEIQRESFAYTEGLKANLQQMANDWAGADAAGKELILAGVRTQYGSVDTSGYPQHLKDFLCTAGIY